jgi:hypothetical protein
MLSYVLQSKDNENNSGRRYKIKPASGLVSKRIEAVHQDGFFVNNSDQYILTEG